jgi:hypothetical protein
LATLTSSIRQEKNYRFPLPKNSARENTFPGFTLLYRYLLACCLLQVAVMSAVCFECPEYIPVR